jgi:hypothetical protein
MQLHYLVNATNVFALDAFAQAHAPLLEFPALYPVAVPLALPSMVLSMAPTTEALDDVAPVLTPPKSRKKGR